MVIGGSENNTVWKKCYHDDSDTVLGSRVYALGEGHERVKIQFKIGEGSTNLLYLGIVEEGSITNYNRDNCDIGYCMNVGSNYI